MLQEVDSSALKINPIKIIELEEKSDLTKLGELEKTFKEVFNNINENEYWKIKSGIIGGKLHVDENSISVGSETEKTDSLISNNPKDPFKSENGELQILLGSPHLKMKKSGTSYTIPINTNTRFLEQL